LPSGIPDQPDQLGVGHGPAGLPASHVGNQLLLHRAVHIVRPKRKRDLGQLGTDHHPVGLNMRKVVKKTAGHSDVFEIVKTAGLGQLVQLGVLGMKGQGNKGKKAAGFILGLPEGGKMLDPLLHGLNMPIEHGGVTLEPDAMRCLGNLKPALAGKLFLAGALSDPGAEHLGPTAGDRTQPGGNQFLKGLGHRLSGKLGQMGNLYTGKGLDVDLGPHLLDAAQHVQIILVRQIRVNPAHHMHLGDGFSQTLPHLGLDLLHRHLIGLRRLFVLAKGAELTKIGADVRVIDVLIVDEIGAVAVDPLPHQVG